MSALLVAHSFMRWVVIVALVVSGGYALTLANDKSEFDPRPFSVVAAVVDVQVLLGIVLYVFGSGWGERWFLSVVHPLLMLAAAASVHIGLVRARRRAHRGRRALRIVGVAYLLPLLLFAVGVPWAG